MNIAEKWCRCMPFAKVLLIPTTIFFESIVYRDILWKERMKWKNLDFVGITTYKSLKFIAIEKLKAYLELGFYKPYDVVPLYGTGELLMDQAIKGHTEEFRSIWYETLNQLGYHKNVDFIDRKEVFLRNSYLARPKALEGLISFMNRSISTVSGSPRLQMILSKDAHYQEAKKKVAESVFHSDVYQFYPFVFERLPVFYFHYYNLSVFTSLDQYAYFSNEEVDTLFEGI